MNNNYEKQGYKVFKVKNSDSCILYRKSDIAYTLAYLITKSKSKAKIMEADCKNTGIAWFQIDDTKEVKNRKYVSGTVEQIIYKELVKVKNYIDELEDTDYKKLKDIANSNLTKKSSYQLLHTKLYYDLGLIYKNNNWFVNFTTKEYPVISSIEKE